MEEKEIEEYIEKNYHTLWKMCESAAAQGMPMKRKYGHCDHDDTFIDEAEFIFDELLKPAIETYLEEKSMQIYKGGCYAVYADDGCDDNININIYFELTGIDLEL